MGIYSIMVRTCRIRASRIYILYPDLGYLDIRLILVLLEFRVFVDHAERKLWEMFQSIDRNQNGELDKGELKAAFARAGVSVSNSKLDQFFAEVDTNRDGVITFEEWRYVGTNHATDGGASIHIPPFDRLHARC